MIPEVPLTFSLLMLPAMKSTRGYGWIGILAATVLGLVWSLPGRVPHGVLQGLLMLILFFSCLELRPRVLLMEAGREWRPILAMLALLSLLSPLLVLPFRSFFDAGTYTGLILAGTMSTGLAVIFLSEQLGGSPGQALILAFISSVLAPVTVPAVVSLFAGGSVPIDFLEMSARTAFIVLVPLAAAVATGHTAAGRKLGRIRGPVSRVIFVTLIVTLVSSVRHLVLLDPARSMGVFCVAVVLSLVCAALGMLIGRGGRQKMTFAVVAGFRNSTLATVLALTVFDESVALPSVMFVITGNLMVITLQLFSRKFIEAV